MFVDYVQNYIQKYKSSVKTRSITFDGLPPFAKLREQVKRRRYRLLTEKFSFSFNAKFLKEIELMFTLSGWHVISSEIVGEGEQKLANHISQSEIDNILVITRDWDFMLILLPMTLNKKISLDMMFLKNIIDVSYIAEEIGIDNLLHFVSAVCLFGTDFFPGLSNLPLCKENLDPLMKTRSWVSIVHNSVVLIKDPFIEMLSSFEKLCSREYRACRGCEVCEPKSSSDQEIQSFIHNYLWTIGYFFMRDHKYQFVSWSNQFSVNDLGLNYKDIQMYIDTNVRRYMSVDMIIHVMEKQNYESFLSEKTQTSQIEILPACDFHIRSYVPFMRIRI